MGTVQADVPILATTHAKEVALDAVVAVQSVAQAVVIKVVQVRR